MKFSLSLLNILICNNILGVNSIDLFIFNFLDQGWSI